MPSGGEDVGEHHIVGFLLLRVLGEAKEVEIAERHPQILGLPAPERSHPGEPIGGAGHLRVGIHRQTERRQTLFTVTAETATDVEGHTHPIPWRYFDNRIADLGNDAHILMTEHHALLKIGAALVHVQVRPTDIGGGDLHQHIGRVLDLGIRNIFDDDVTRSVVHKCFHS